MELGQLRHFLAVFKEGNFARAARRCGVSQQALSGSIARLERDIGVRLFDRGRIGAVPTTEGEAFAPFVELAFTELHRGEQALAEAGEGNIGELRFGIGQTFSGHIVPEAIAQMNQERPGVAISIVEGYAPDLAQQVIDGKLDFFVGAPTETMVSNTDLRVEPLFEISDQIVCRASHPLCAQTKVSLEDMAGFPWLFPSPPSEEEHAVIHAYGHANRLPPPLIVYSDTIATALSLLALADYLLVGQTELLAPMFESGILTTLDSAIELPRRTGYIGTRRIGVLRPCVRRIVEIIEAKAAEFARRVSNSH